MHVKKDDKVVILTGKDRGKTGRILEVDPRGNRVKVERRNLIIKHQRPNPLTGTEGARIERENWIHASNVALFSEQLDGPVRVSRRFVGRDGQLFHTRREAVGSFGGDAPARIKKVRVSNKTGEVFDPV